MTVAVPRSSRFRVQKDETMSEVKMLDMALRPLIERVDKTLGQTDNARKKIDELAALLPGMLDDLSPEDKAASRGSRWRYSSWPSARAPTPTAT
jgi:hypothetical protein